MQHLKHLRSTGSELVASNLRLILESEVDTSDLFSFTSLWFIDV
jgi:hypothetical protein